MIATLMGNPKAGAIYMNIPATTPPAICADRYKLAAMDRDTDTMEAYEQHIRDLARLHFDRVDVLQALQSMERDKKRRKMGKSGNKDLKNIARHIREQYANNDYQLVGDRLNFQIRTTPGKFMTVRCKDTPGSVEQVARKFERGYKR